MPVTPALPDRWYDSPNIHLCTTRDFVALCRDLGIEIERALALDNRGCPLPVRAPWLANLQGQHAMFLLSRDP